MNLFSPRPFQLIMIGLATGIATAAPGAQSLAPDIVVAKVVNAPVAEVWKAWTTAEGIESFFAPKAAKVDPVPKAGFKWSTFDITADGPHLVVFMDGNKTSEITDSTYTSGPIALQYGGGIVKWRKVEVRPITH